MVFQSSLRCIRLTVLDNVMLALEARRLLDENVTKAEKLDDS